LEGSQNYALVISGPVTEIAADPAAVGLDKWPPQPLEGETVSMNFTVQNMGYGPAVNFPYDITVDGSPLQEGILPDLGAGDATVVRSNWTAVRGDHTLKLVVNPLGTIDEINATNDTSRADITVLYFGVMVTASPFGLLLDPGAIGHFEGAVTNSGTAADTTALAFRFAAYVSTCPRWP
jgi:hypothetical protein